MWFVRLKPKCGYQYNAHNIHALLKSKLYSELDSMGIWRSRYYSDWDFSVAKNEVYKKLLVYIRDHFDKIDDASKEKAGCTYGLCCVTSCKNKLILC